jgi:hypothetical protein
VRDRLRSQLGLICSAAVIVALGMEFCVTNVTPRANEPVEPPPQTRFGDDPADAAAARATPALEMSKLARLMGVPSGNPAGSAKDSVRREVGESQARSTLPFSLTGTAIATPGRYSLCLLRSTETNISRVYGIGDRVMDAHIHAITKERVLIEHDGRVEYIDAAPSQAPSIAQDHALDPYAFSSVPINPHMR